MTISLDQPENRLMVRILTAKECKRFYVPMSDREDVLQDILCKLIEKKYLEKWDPSYGVILAAYIRVFIRHELIRRYFRVKKESRLFHALEFSSEDSEQVAFSKLIPVSDLTAVEVDLREDILVLVRQLEKEFPHYSSVVYAVDKSGFLQFVTKIKGKPAEEYYLSNGFLVYPRALSYIFELLALQHSQVEIANYLKVSRHWVTGMVAKLRSFEPIMKFLGKIE